MKEKVLQLRFDNVLIEFKLMELKVSYIGTSKRLFIVIIRRILVLNGLLMLLYFISPGWSIPLFFLTIILYQLAPSVLSVGIQTALSLGNFQRALVLARLLCAFSFT